MSPISRFPVEEPLPAPSVTAGPGALEGVLLHSGLGHPQLYTYGGEPHLPADRLVRGPPGPAQVENGTRECTLTALWEHCMSQCHTGNESD